MHLYDPGTLPSSAIECSLGKVYLRSDVSRKQLASTAQLVKLSAGDGGGCDRASQPVVCGPEVHAGSHQYPLARGQAARACC